MMKWTDHEIDEFLTGMTGLKAMSMVAADLSEEEPDEMGPFSFHVHTRINHRGKMVVEAVMQEKASETFSGRGQSLTEAIADLVGVMKHSPASENMAKVLEEIVSRLKDGRMQPA